MLKREKKTTTIFLKCIFRSWAVMRTWGVRVLRGFTLVRTPYREVLQATERLVSLDGSASNEQAGWWMSASAGRLLKLSVCVSVCVLMMFYSKAIWWMVRLANCSFFAISWSVLATKVPPALKTFQRIKYGHRFIVGSTNQDSVCQWKTETDSTDVDENEFWQKQVLCFLCTTGVKMSLISLSSLIGSSVVL